MDKAELTKIRDDLNRILTNKSLEKITDGSSEQFSAGVGSGYYDAACEVCNYFVKEYGLGLPTED